MSTTPQPDSTERARILRERLIAMRPSSAEPGPQSVPQNVPKTSAADVESLIAEGRAAAERNQGSTNHSPTSTTNESATLSQEQTPVSAAPKTADDKVEDTSKQGVQKLQKGSKEQEATLKAAMPSTTPHLTNTENNTALRQREEPNSPTHAAPLSSPSISNKTGTDIQKRQNEAEPVASRPQDQLVRVDGDETIDDLDRPPRNAAQYSHYFDDLDEWLEITGYHNRQFRQRHIKRHRALAEFEARKAEIEAEIATDDGPRPPVYLAGQPRISAASAMPPPPRPLGLPSPVSPDVTADILQRNSKRPLSQENASASFEPPNKIQRVGTSNSARTAASTSSSRAVTASNNARSGRNDDDLRVRGAGDGSGPNTRLPNRPQIGQSRARSRSPPVRRAPAATAGPSASRPFNERPRNSIELIAPRQKNVPIDRGRSVPPPNRRMVDTYEPYPPRSERSHGPDRPSNARDAFPSHARSDEPRPPRQGKYTGSYRRYSQI